MPPSIEQLIEHSRRELLDLSMRNRLLSIGAKSRSSRILMIHDELSKQVFRLLVTEKKPLSFLPVQQNGQRTDETDASLANDEGMFLPQPDDEEDPRTGLQKRHTDSRLQTALSSERLQHRLLALYRDAQTMLEEQGVHILYLALGQLKWFESKDSDTPRFAPLILIPVELQRKSASDRFHLVWREEDIEENLSLEAKLKADFGTTFPRFPEDDELNPDRYFEEVARCVGGDKERWEVLPNAITLGFFSFAKFLMYRDLDPATWPHADHLLRHPLITGLLQDGFPQTDPLFPADTNLDQLIPVSRLDHVVDADGSQTRAIELVRQGHNLVIQGPPGTGKSQSITNIIATAVLDGKTVLFVAEKMAALEVVKRRLEKEGLGSLCLELHSHKAQKRAVIEEIGRTWRLGRPKSTQAEMLIPKLERCRQTLNDHVQALHERVEPCGLTPFAVIGSLTLLGSHACEVADLDLPGAERWTTEQRADYRTLVEDLASRIEQIGLPSQHPWRGVQRTNLLQIDVPPIEGEIRDLSQRLGDMSQAATDLAQTMAQPVPSTLGDMRRLLLIAQHVASAPPVDKQALCHGVWNLGVDSLRDLIAHGRLFARATKDLGSAVIDDIWAQDFSKSRAAVAAHGQSFLAFLNGDYRRAMAQLKGALREPPPKGYGARVALLDDIVEGQRALRAITQSDELGRTAFGTLWRRERTDWAQLEAVVEWVTGQHKAGLGESFRRTFAEITDPQQVGTSAEAVSCHCTAVEENAEQLFGALDLNCQDAFGAKDLEHVPLHTFGTRCEAWLSALEGLIQWSQYCSRASAIRQAGLGGLMTKLEAGALPPKSAAAAFDRMYYSRLLRDFVRQKPALGQFDGNVHSQHVEDFRQHDSARLVLAKHLILLTHFERLPISSGVGAAGILRGEMERKRGHRTVRRLLKDCGSAVQSIKPVFMMSPLSVAQFLEAGSVQFDLLVIDEASQVQPVDALGAIARCNQVVVVGDAKQLPPTRFFSQMTSDDEDPGQEDGDVQIATAKDMESVLGLCCARGIPQSMLRWHYRSRHHSLIAVSNHEFYDDSLFIVPSPHAESDHMGIQFTFVPGGVFDSGQSGTNRIEAKVIAEAVIEHARKTPQFSLGVVAFSVRQRQAILDELELLRRINPDVESFFSAHATEPVFVKNLENVQGDERDVIFISVGYAKNAQGYMAMRFGPLSMEGGERRLNVLISRAKFKCQVFSSITAEDLDLERAPGRGVAALKTFLSFAKTKRLAIAERSGRFEESPFEVAVRRAIESAGHKVHPQVGMAGFFIDLAIVDPQEPGRYLLGIECDGAAYHSSRSARDRDRLRQAVLESHGWTIHRVWSTDWFQHPNQELKKVLSAIERASVTIQQELPPPVPRTTETACPATDYPIERESPSRNGVERGLEDLAAPYKEAWFEVPCNVAPHEVPAHTMAEIVLRIVQDEGPIHLDEVTTRVRNLWRLGRAGNRIQWAVSGAARSLVKSGSCLQEGSCLSVPGQIVTVRRRDSVSSASLRKPELLPPAEVRAAIRLLLCANHNAMKHEIPTAVARIFGFKNTSAQLRHLVDGQISRLLCERVITEVDGMTKINTSNQLPVSA